MCLVCTEYFKGNLNFRDAKRNIAEIGNSSDNEKDREHAKEALEFIELLEKSSVN